MRMPAVTLATFCVLCSARLHAQQQPPALNPFGHKSESREDAQPGCAFLSDGAIHIGKLYLTRDVRLRIYDAQSQRQREIPFRVVKSIECKVKKEWMEREWRFKENANNEKVFTGREYPAREYLHRITLKDGRRITGSLSGIVYLEPHDGSERQKLRLHKRQKGPIDSNLGSLVYVQKVELGAKAMKEAFARRQQQATPCAR